MSKREASIGDWARVLFWFGLHLDWTLSRRGDDKLEGSLVRVLVDAKRMRAWSRRKRAEMDAEDGV